MSLAGTTSDVPVPVRRGATLRARLGLYAELTKARLSTLVVFTTAVGFLASAGPGATWWRGLLTIAGTALAAAAAATFNQIAEVARDGRMERTRNRPLPTGRLGLRSSLALGLALGAAGLAVLGLGANPAAAALALLTILIYVLAYTPLKTRSTLNTLVGAVCGALPPMIGRVAATGRLDEAAWILGGVLFVWQIPHFLALAWIYREDYRRGGFVMLPVVDQTGTTTAQAMVLSSLLLVPLALLLTMIDAAGAVFAFASLPLGLWLAWLSFRFLQQRTHARARRVFLASITYLPLLLIVLLVDRGLEWRRDRALLETILAQRDVPAAPDAAAPR